MARKVVSSKNKQKMVNDFTAALMRMAQEVAVNPSLHNKQWAQELGTAEWLRRGKVLHQLEKDKKAIREVLQKRNAELSNLSASLMQLNRGYEKLPEYEAAQKEESKWGQYSSHAAGNIRDSERIMANMDARSPKFAKQYAKSAARIGAWTAFVTGLFGFNAYAAQMQKYQAIVSENTDTKTGYDKKVEVAQSAMNKIVQQWQTDHKDEVESAKSAVSEMTQKVSATRLQLDAYERQAAAEQSQARAHFKKVFEGKMSPATQKEFSKHLEHVHSNKVAPTQPISSSDSFSESFSHNLFMQQTLWLLASDYESSYTAVSHTATDLSSSSTSDFSSSMLNDYGMSSSTDSSSSYSSHSSSNYDSGSSSSSHSSWSPSPSSCSSSSSSSCGSSCGGGGGD